MAHSHGPLCFVGAWWGYTSSTHHHHVHQQRPSPLWREVPKLYRESDLGTPRGRQVHYDTKVGGVWLIDMGCCALWVLGGVILAAPLQTAGASVADIYIIDHAGCWMLWLISDDQQTYALCYWCSVQSIDIYQAD